MDRRIILGGIALIVTATAIGLGFDGLNRMRKMAITQATNVNDSQVAKTLEGQMRAKATYGDNVSDVSDFNSFFPNVALPNYITPNREVVYMVNANPGPAMEPLVTQLSQNDTLLVEMNPNTAKLALATYSK